MQNAVRRRKSRMDVQNTCRLLAWATCILVPLVSLSGTGVSVETEAGICDTRFVNLVPDPALIADTRRPITRDTDVGGCDTRSPVLMIIVR